MTSIRFLTLNRMIGFNIELKQRAKENNRIYYVNRSVPSKATNALHHIPDSAEKYYSRTGDMILTAAYYLKNIIVLQAFEDGNHRTALYVTEFFFKSNGFITKEISDECYLSFRTRLLMWRHKDYHTLESMDSKILKIEDNIPIEENYVFEFCLKFIKNEILR